MLYEGKAKRSMPPWIPSCALSATRTMQRLLTGSKRGRLPVKVVNNKTTNHLMQMLEKKGIPTHFVKELSDRKLLFAGDHCAAEVIVRNRGRLHFQAAGSGGGVASSQTVLEFCYKDDALGDPMVNEYHILAMRLATKEELDQIASYALAVNTHLSSYLLPLGIELIDFKLEFGKTQGGKLVLADEISPDTCRFWDSKTGEKLDKDRFRRDMGQVEEAYQEILRRLMGA